jgi:predicted TIM-barrel fold metal-dependent hydrolase
MINTHSHHFKDKDIPVDLLPLKLVPILQTKVGYFLLSRLLTNLNPFSNKDMFDRVVQMIKVLEKKSSREIFETQMAFYPSDTKFISLTMDMSQMGAGKVPRSFELQLIELSQLASIYPNIIPFVHIDPRREGYYELFKKAIEQWGFKGLKLYPPLGVFPYDERFYLIYDYCQKHGLPVIAHCTPDNPIHFKGSDKELRVLLMKSKEVVIGKTRKELCANFTKPSNYEYVLKDFPDLKISCAHFGREKQWDDICKDLMVKYRNFFVDYSYTMAFEEHWPMMKLLMTAEENKTLRGKIMFGTDFPMNIMECTEKEFTVAFRAYMGEDVFNRTAVTNPLLFLS